MTPHPSDRCPACGVSPADYARAVAHNGGHTDKYTGLRLGDAVALFRVRSTRGTRWVAVLRDDGTYGERMVSR